MHGTLPVAAPLIGEAPTDATNPEGKPAAEVPTSLEQLEAALSAAAAAAPMWAATPAVDRAIALRAIAHQMETGGDELVRICEEETHLGVAKLGGELARTCFQLRAFASLLESGSYLAPTLTAADDRPPPEGHPQLALYHIPLGPVAVFGASNFPLAFGVIGGDAVSALAAGCPVITKGHHAHPRFARAVADTVSAALESTDAPAGVFAFVTGRDIGQQLVRDPRIKAAGFTGSLTGGRALFDIAVARPDPIPFYGELSSVNPVFATAAALADPSAFADAFLTSLTIGTGQMCTKPGLLIVPAAAGLGAVIAERAGAVTPGQFVHPSVAAGFDSAVEVLAAQPGVTALYGNANTADRTEDLTQQPVVFTVTAAQAASDRTIYTTEMFGPAAVLIEYDSDAEALDLAGQLDGCLAAAVHAAPDEQLANDLVAVLTQRAGRVIWGGWPTGVAVDQAQNHGGPWPSTTDSRHTSVGLRAIDRWVRPVAFQSMPEHLLPAAVAAAAY